MGTCNTYGAKVIVRYTFEPGIFYPRAKLTPPQSNTKTCFHCYFTQASLKTFERAELFKDARGVQRAILIDAMSFQNEAEMYTCNCDNGLDKAA